VNGVTDLDALLDALADRLAGRVAARLHANGNGNGHVPEIGADKLLPADEAAAQLGVTRRWVYAHKDRLPVVSMPGRTLRFSAAGLQRWIGRRQSNNQRGGSK